MNRQGIAFATSFIVAVCFVAPLVYFDQTFWALAVGIAGLICHWRWSREGSVDDEVADASYFLGFMLTLVFLAVGLYKLGAPAASAVTSGGKSPNAAGSTTVILGFLKDLAAGLALTIVGLGVRQMRTLAGAAIRSSENSLLAAQLQLTRNLEALIKVWSERPEHQVLEELHESRTIARDATASLHKDVIAAGKRMLAMSAKLEDAATDATQTMTRAASALSESLSQTMQRVDAEVALLLVTFQQQREQTSGALTDAQKAASKMREDADAHLHQHLNLWRETLDRARAALAAVHQSLDEEYRRGLDGFASAGTAFADLTKQTVRYVEALPNPASRLSGLWDGVTKLDTTLTAAINGAIGELGVLRDRSEKAAAALGQLGGSATASATSISSGGERFASELEREIRQMNRLVDEYILLLQAATRSAHVRT